jgi:tetratricopeptide (TPR) repeat protein
MRLLAICLCATAAWAQADLDPDTEIARHHFEIGRISYEAGDYVTALREFEAARKTKALPAFDYNIARCLDRLERRAQAVTAYERYLSGVGDQPDAEEVRERVRVLKERIAADATLTKGPPPPRPPRSRRWIAPGVVGGAAVAAAVVGAGLLGSVRVDVDRMLSGPGSCRPCSDAQVDPLRVRADAGYAMLGLAGALAVVDIVLWVRARR